MGNIDIPHFDLPFRYLNGKVVVVQQDMIDDIRNCVFAIASTEMGEREDLPEFGIASPVFENEPIDTQAVLSKILQDEPRATILMEEYPEMMKELLILRVGAA